MLAGPAPAPRSVMPAPVLHSVRLVRLILFTLQHDLRSSMPPGFLRTQECMPLAPRATRGRREDMTKDMLVFLVFSDSAPAGARLTAPALCRQFTTC